MSMSMDFLLWLQDEKKFSHRDALDIIKRFNKFKETALDKMLFSEYINSKK